MQELQIEARVENLSDVLAFVDEILEGADCSMPIQMQIDVAVEEVFVNIAHYAYTPQTGPAIIRMEITESPATAVITFLDEGIPFDPTQKEDPDTSLPVSERQIGGLGIYMVKKSMDTVTYRREGGQNILCIQKKL